MVVAKRQNCIPAIAGRTALGGRQAPLYAGRHVRGALQRPVPARSGFVRLTLIYMPPLTRDDLTELHCIQPFDNVLSILAGGILSHYQAKDVDHKSIASPLVQARREPVYVPGPSSTKRKLHSYANLYVNARNKMLSKIKYDHGDLDICVMRISLDVLDLPGVVVASQNASSDYARFAAAPDGLGLIDKDMVFASSWKHPNDQIAEWRHGSIMCAEVLVPDSVEPEYIEGAYVSCKAARKALRRTVEDGSFDLTINEDLFFRP
jgi:hypothetical protein